MSRRSPGQSQNQSVTVNVNNTRGGCGCGALIGFLALLLVVGYVFGALGGEYGLLWQVVAWVGLVLVVLGGAGAALGYLDRQFGWGIFEPGEIAEPTKLSEPEQSQDDDRNYGRQTPD